MLRLTSLRATLALPLATAVAAQPAARAQTIELTAGLVITTSVRVAKGTYRLPAPASLDSAVIVVRGRGVTVDFGGATLEGTAPGADPDLATGVAIRVEGGEGVQILHARIRGYRVGILAPGTRALTLVGNDLGDNWKPRLFSVVEHESLADWLSFHHNEQDEWLRFGAAIYLAGVTGGEIRDNQAERGMNGLLLVRSDSLRIRDNTFSFNSGLGIGLYRSSDNTIVHNRLDYDVRGYSHGFYRRGQDSAGLLMYEQSSGNVVAYNSVTHGGDGLFLWAGQSTMDTGERGANDNWFIANDFSFAPANGIEATFSRNHFVANRVVGSDYGLWGGYSFESRVSGNCFSRNRVGVAIEHGQDNRIEGNRFEGDSTAVSLWANPIEPSDWGYPKKRDTRSRDYRVVGNVFAGNRVAVRAANTFGLVMEDNRAVRVDSLTVMRDTSAVRATPGATGPRPGGPGIADNPCTTAPPLRGVPEPIVAAAVQAGRSVPATSLSRLDRSAIVVDSWGPYDYRSPKLWPLDSARAVPLRLRVLGPTGSWRVGSKRGVALLSKAAGRIGDTISVTPVADSAGDWALTLEYTRAGASAPSGGRPGRERFTYSHYEPRADWTVRFFAWGETTDPRSHGDAFSELLRATPLLTRHEPRLDYEWYRPALKELPPAHWALDATASVTLAPGAYTLRTISDDAARVWVDGVLVIDDWTPHESAVDWAPLAGGTHELRVQYFQVDGWTELRLEIVRGTQRSRGSPGPH